MKAILLAAGRGSRLGTITAERPKCFVEVHGKPLVRWQIDTLAAAGVDDVAVVRGYLADFWDRQELGVARFFTNSRWQQTNMVASLACASEWLSQAPCLISYTDIVYGPETVRRLTAAEGDLVITQDPDWLSLWSRRFANPLDDAETFATDIDGRLLVIGARPKSLADVQGQYMGLLRTTPDGWRAVSDYLSSLPADEADRLDMTSLLSRLLAQGMEIRTIPAAGPWCEIDQESDIAVAEDIFSREGAMEP